MFDMFGIRQAIKDFEERNGTEFIGIEKNAWFLYANGAMRENSSPLCAMIDPPDHPVKRAKLIVRFHQERLNRAKDAFDERKHFILEAARVPQMVIDEEASLKDLKTLQDAVLERQAALAEAQKQVELASGITPEEARRRAESAAADAGRRAEFVGQIRRIAV